MSQDVKDVQDFKLLSDDELLAELSGPDAGCAIPNDPVTPEGARQAVQTARRYVMP
jgi:hypothetical protein